MAAYPQPQLAANLTKGVPRQCANTDTGPRMTVTRTVPMAFTPVFFRALLRALIYPKRSTLDRGEPCLAPARRVRASIEGRRYGEYLT